TRRCHRSGVPLRTLGSGANLLVADEGVDGIVIKLDAPAFRRVKHEEELGDTPLMRAMAGADLARTLMDAVRRGLGGLEAMAGIPASVGGAINPIATITRPNQGSVRPAPAVWAGYSRELDNLVYGAKISSGYGLRYHPLLGYRVMHRGIDLAASRGMPNKASADGVIDWTGRNGAYGNYLRIRHDAIYQTAYGHLSRFVDGIGKGTRVQRGDVIGYVGRTGRATAPSLHYEVRLNNHPLNPREFLRPSGIQVASLRSLAAGGGD
ncbi:MAG: M23 family metallopeptidase, partial [Acidobacteria bacterium]|nr:M23 family metallopeptidase [Acidobacteriota bacterium]